jgi:hypothetical protein
MLLVFLHCPFEFKCACTFLHFTPPFPQFSLKSGYSRHVGLTRLSNKTSANTVVPLSLPHHYLFRGSQGGRGRGMKELMGGLGGGVEDESYFQLISYKTILENRSFLLSGHVPLRVRDKKTKNSCPPIPAYKQDILEQITEYLQSYLSCKFIDDYSGFTLFPPTYGVGEQEIWPSWTFPFPLYSV